MANEPTLKTNVPEGNWGNWKSWRTNTTAKNKAVNNKAVNNKAVNNKAVNNKAGNNKAVNNKSVNNEVNNNEVNNNEVNNNEVNNLELNFQWKEAYTPLEVSDDQIYFYLGHGSTLQHSDGTLQLELVPENCLYITQTVCGIVNFMGDEIFQAFCNKDNEEMWRDPINNIEKINKLFESMPGVHIHYPNTTFVNTSFHPCSANGDGGKYLIEYSGLVPLNNAHTISFDSNPTGFRTYNNYNIESKGIKGIPEATVKEMYKYSVYPQLNIREGVTMRYIPPKVNTLYLTSSNGIVSFDSLLEGTKSLARNITVLDLMKSRPGIHFNFLCRSLKLGQHVERRREMTRRRRHSAILQNTVFNSIAKLAYTGFRYGVEKGEMSSDRDVLEFIQSVEDRIRADENLEKFYNAMGELLHYGYKQSFNYLRPIFFEKYLNKFSSLMQEGASSEEIKRFLDILKPDIHYINQPKYALEAELLNRMATYAFAVGNRSIARKLCGMGAPIQGMQREYNQIKGFFTAKTLRQRKHILQDCRRAFAKAKTRRARENNSNSSSRNSNSNE